MDCEFFQSNRRRLIAGLPDRSLLVLFSGKAPRRTADSYYEFFADRNFVYLTGIESEGSVYLAYKHGTGVEETLFLEDSPAQRATGPVLTMQEAKDKSGIEDVTRSDRFFQAFHRYLRKERDVLLFLNLDRLAPGPQKDEAHGFAEYARDMYPHLPIRNLYPDICELRVIKTPAEIANMKCAMEHTRKGIEAMMGMCRPGLHEYDLEAVFHYTLARNGLRRVAFPAIIASGRNCFYAHYDKPYGVIGEDDLVLADVGAIHDGCCVDVSRMFPANGVFSGLQKEVYQAALESNKDVMRWVKPGIGIAELNEWGQAQAYQRMKELGYQGGANDDKFYSGHYIGFDVHDVGSYQRVLCEGMVLSVDTGIYLENWNVALRVEDDMLITKDGCVDLSKDIIREIPDIESYMASQRRGG
jgi:Xaa-Pro aminopeptidase